ncbi:MAG: aldose 1-epimerase [Chloroflexota bacterium]|nr:aldose 1-epimerase [Chloroflexota bacterium]
MPAEHWLRQPDAVAAFTPSEGFCCTAFRVRLPEPGGATPADAAALADGTTGMSTGFLSVLAEAPSWAALTARPSFFGNPLLFPFAYGVAGGTFEYRDQRYTLRPTRWGRVAHGLVRDHSWTVDGTWSDADGDHIRASITTAGDAGMLAEFPFPFRLTATYTLSGASLTLVAAATNLGSGPMPFGFGVHPYLPIPFAPDGELTDDVVRADPDQLDAGGAPSAGGSIALAPAAAPFDLRAGRTVAALLEAQGALRGAGGGLYVTYAKRAEKADKADKDEGIAGIRWSLVNRRRGVTVEIETGEDCRAMVLFAPREPTTVISPVIGTCLPGFLDDAARGRDLGRLELAPGETWSTRVVVRVRLDPPINTPS